MSTRLQTPLLALAAVASLGIGIAHELANSGPDYCQLANLRQCKVADNGTWVMVTTPDGASNLIVIKNGKVVQVLR